MSIKHLYEDERPSLLLDFANSKTLDPRITFTRNSTATYVDEQGVIKTAAAGEARFDHNGATGESLGLLIEESRTNEFPFSEDFSNTSWTKVNTTVTPNATTAPDGTLTADRLQIGATNGVVYNNTVGGVASNSTISMWVKAVTPGTDDVFRLASAGDLSADITATDEWVRHTLTSTTFTSSLHGIARPADNTAADVYVWGAQFEETKLFPTSYIPTSGSTVTRNADEADITGTNFSSWYNQNTGTWISTINTAVPTTGRLLEVGTPGTSISVRPGPTSTSIARQGSSADTVNNTYPAKFGATNNVTQIRLWVNGTAGNAVTNGISNTNATVLGVGQTISNILQLNAPIANISFYPTILSDTTLEALTK